MTGALRSTFTARRGDADYFIFDKCGFRDIIRNTVKERCAQLVVPSSQRRRSGRVSTAQISGRKGHGLEALSFETWRKPPVSRIPKGTESFSL